MTIIEMIYHHAQLSRQMDRLYAMGGDDATEGPAYRALSREAMTLENRIVATRATSAADRAAKLRFIEKTEIDLGQLVAMILTLDAEQIAAAA